MGCKCPPQLGYYHPSSLSTTTLPAWVLLPPQLEYYYPPSSLEFHTGLELISWLIMKLVTRKNCCILSRRRRGGGDHALRVVLMGTKSCTKIFNFSTRFSSVEDFVTLLIGKKSCWWGNLMFGHDFGILVYALLCGGDTKFKLPKAGNGNVFFPNKRVRFARPDKAVALQYHNQWSTNTNVCGGFTLGVMLVDEHTHSPARMRYSIHCCTLSYVQNERQTPHRCCGLLTPKLQGF